MHRKLGKQTCAYLNIDTEALKKTTLCYLTLPSLFNTSSQGPDQNDSVSGWDTGLSMTIDPASMTITPAQRKRFARAMHVLQLELYVHPSELHTLSAIDGRNGGGTIAGDHLSRKTMEYDEMQSRLEGKTILYTNFD